MIKILENNHGRPVVRPKKDEMNEERRFSIIKKIESSTPDTKVFIANEFTTQKKVVIAEICSNYDNEDLGRKVKRISESNSGLILKLREFLPNGFDNGENCPSIVTDYMPNGSLAELIDGKGDFSSITIDNTKKMIWIYGIAQGIEYLHSMNVLHQDLNSHNVLFDQNYYPKISICVPSIFHNDAMSSSLNSIDTIFYMPPERFNAPYQSFCNDIYSYGMLIYIILTGTNPYKGRDPESVKDEILEGKRPEIPDDIPNEFRQLIRDCWSQEPSDRPTLTNILDFFNQGNYLPNIDFVEFSKYIVSIPPISVLSSNDQSLLSIASKNYVEHEYFSAFHIFNYIANQYNDSAAQNWVGMCYKLGRGVPKDYNQAVKYFQLSADQNFAQGQCNLGLCYKAGLGVEQNSTMAAFCFKMAALKYDNLSQQSSTQALIDLGLSYKQGQGVQQSNQEAAKYFKIAADKSNPEAQYMIGLCYKQGNGIEQNYEQAAYYFKQGAQQNHAKSQYAYAICLANGEGVQQNLGEAIKLLKLAANQHLTEAQTYLGSCYEQGIGCPVDIEEAKRFYELAATQNNPQAQCAYGVCLFNSHQYELAVKYFSLATEHGDMEAQCCLGVCYANGQGVEQNIEEAIRLYRLSANQNHARAQCYLGACYENGDGIEQDLNEAIRLYRLAVEQGCSEAMCNLASCYYDGSGVEQSYIEAAKSYAKAAENGLPEAEFCLAICYQYGQGVEKSISNAIKFYQLAAEHGLSIAQDKLNKLKSATSDKRQ